MQPWTVERTETVKRTHAIEAAETIEAVEPADALASEDDDYRRIARAITFLDARRIEQPSLDEVAEHVGLSAFHFQRLFRRWAGVSPKRFLQALTAEKAKSLLRSGASVLDASFDSGLSGPGRLHDLLVAFEAMTPGEYKLRGRGLEIRYGFHPTPFGEALISTTERGVCGLVFVSKGDCAASLSDLRGRWPGAQFLEHSGDTAPLARHIFGHETKTSDRLHLLVRGTNFQVQVWQALLRIPPGRLATYGDLAAAIGAPGAARAVGSAVGANPVSYLIPCHRVIRRTGALGGYRWGPDRKGAMLAWEAARRADAAVA